MCVFWTDRLARGRLALGPFTSQPHTPSLSRTTRRHARRHGWAGCCWQLTQALKSNGWNGWWVCSIQGPDPMEAPAYSLASVTVLMSRNPNVHKCQSVVEYCAHNRAESGLYFFFICANKKERMSVLRLADSLSQFLTQWWSAEWKTENNSRPLQKIKLKACILPLLLVVQTKSLDQCNWCFFASMMKAIS